MAKQLSVTAKVLAGMVLPVMLGCGREAKATDMCIYPDTLGAVPIRGAVDAQGNPASVRTIIRARMPCDSIPAEIRERYRVRPESVSKP